MGNLAFLVRRGRLSTKALQEATHAVNETLFGGIFDIEEYDDGVTIGLEGKQWFELWRMSPGKFGGKFPRQGQVGHWIYLRFSENIADRLNLKRAYEFEPGLHDPKPDLYPTFEGFLRAQYRGLDKSFIKNALARLLMKLEHVPAPLRPYVQIKSRSGQPTAPRVG